MQALDFKKMKNISGFAQPTIIFFNVSFVVGLLATGPKTLAYLGIYMGIGLSLLFALKSWADEIKYRNPEIKKFYPLEHEKLRANALRALDFSLAILFICICTAIWFQVSGYPNEQTKQIEKIEQGKPVLPEIEKQDSQKNVIIDVTK
jgi:hypothetical protein